MMGTLTFETQTARALCPGCSQVTDHEVMVPSDPRMALSRECQGCGWCW